MIEVASLISEAWLRVPGCALFLEELDLVDELNDIIFELIPLTEDMLASARFAVFSVLDDSVDILAITGHRSHSHPTLAVALLLHGWRLGRSPIEAVLIRLRLSDGWLVSDKGHLRLAELLEGDVRCALVTQVDMVTVDEESGSLQLLSLVGTPSFGVLPLSLLVFRGSGKTSLRAETVVGLTITAHLVMWVLPVASIATVAASILDSLFFGFYKLVCIIFILISRFRFDKYF